MNSLQQDYRVVNEAVTVPQADAPDKADFDFVALRFEDAAATLRNTPVTGSIRRQVTYWPDVIESYWGYGVYTSPDYDKKQNGRTPPSAKAIDRLNETLEWLFYVPGDTDPEKHIFRSIVMARAMINPVTGKHTFSYRRLGAKLNCSKDKVKDLWLEAIITIMWRINNG